MTEIYYDRPPIIEAVIELLFSTLVSEDELEEAKKYLKKNYVNEVPLEEIEFNLQIESSDVKRNTERFFRYSSQDETQMCLLKRKSFSVSQLAPYTSWNDFITRFERDYQLHKKHVGYKQIKRIGVRYINRIDIPVTDPVIYENDYLNIYPKYPDVLGVLHGYAVQQRSRIDSLKSNLTINSAIVPSPLLHHTSILFDQDIGREEDVPQKIEDLILFLNQARIEKNRIFEACITDKARGLFKK